MKYSKNFNRDVEWYLSVRNTFNFDGKYLTEVEYDKKGADGKRAFYLFDTHGKLVPTKHPNILQVLLRTKGSVNLHIKMFTQGRVDGTLPGIEFKEDCKHWKAPAWFKIAVENQKLKYYDHIRQGA